MIAAARIFAIVPAAGRSRRMGQAKQLMPVDGKPMLSRVLDALTAAGIDGVIVVANSQIAADFPSLSIVLNDDEASEMIDSIRLGLREWDRTHPPRAGDGILICLSDQPSVSPADVERCAAAFRESPDRIVIASHAGKRGHPTIFPRTLSNDVNSPTCDAGLNALPKLHANLVREVECDSSAVQNVNTPADYRDIS